MILSHPRGGSQQFKLLSVTSFTCWISHLVMKLLFCSCHHKNCLLHILPSAFCSSCFLFSLLFSFLWVRLSLHLWLMADRGGRRRAEQTRLLCAPLSIPFHLSRNEVLVSLGECQQCLAMQQVRGAFRLNYNWFLLYSASVWAALVALEMWLWWMDDNRKGSRN